MAATVAAIQATSADLKSAATIQAQQAVSQAALTQATAEARQAVTSTANELFDRKLFDPYLRFASAEDEAAYRKRETERKVELDRALAEKTPEATLHATDLTIDQMKDAGAHGADRSPLYQPKLEGLLSTRDKLATQIAATPEVKSDPLSQDAPAELSPEILAGLKSVGFSSTDQGQQGHGVSQEGQVAINRGR